jgi:predicted amidohydrolase YtcJ
MSHALFSNGLDVRDAKTIDEAVSQITAFAAARKDAVLIGFGASAHSVTERRLPRKSDLDRAAPDRPVFLVKYDGHAAIVNSKLLSLLPGPVSGLRGFDAESGQLTQEAFFGATNFVTGKVSLVRPSPPCSRYSMAWPREASACCTP